MDDKTTVDPLEVAKFAQHATKWWDINGPLKTLHDINPTRLQWIEQFCPIFEKKILDIGCGGGVLSEGLAKKGGIVTGLDVEALAIETAKDHAKEEGITINYICQPLEQFTDHEGYDVITCMEMLEHVTDPTLILHHAARLLKPNGWLFLSTINRTLKAYASAIVAAEYILNIIPRQTHDYEKFIKPSELAQMLRAEGIEPVSISGLNYQPFTRKATLYKSVDVNYLIASQKQTE